MISSCIKDIEKIKRNKFDYIGKMESVLENMLEILNRLVFIKEKGKILIFFFFYILKV